MAETMKQNSMFQAKALREEVNSEVFPQNFEFCFIR